MSITKQAGNFASDLETKIKGERGINLLSATAGCGESFFSAGPSTPEKFCTHADLSEPLLVDCDSGVQGSPLQSDDLSDRPRSDSTTAALAFTPRRSRKGSVQQPTSGADSDLLLFPPRHSPPMESNHSTQATSAQQSTGKGQGHFLAKSLSSTPRRSIAVCEAPPLPPALSALYETAAFHPWRHKPKYLLQILEESSKVLVRKERAEAAQRARELQEKRCAHLYSMAQQRQRRFAQLAEARQRKMEEDSVAACTFTPQVTRAARHHPGKGQDQFMSKCLEWEATVATRLRSRYPPAEITLGTAELQLNSHSVRLIREKELMEGPRPPIWEVPAKRTPSEAAGSSPVPSASPTSRPVTRRVEDDVRGVLDNLGEISPSDATVNHTSRTELVSGRFLLRTQEDLVRRAANAEKLQWQLANENSGEHFAAITGQPLFHPNAVPTVLEEGKRIPYSELPEAKKAEFRQWLRRHGREDALIGYYRQERAKRKKGGDPKAAVSSEALTEASMKRAAEQERIREQCTAEETFHPRISTRSIKIVEKSMEAKNVFERFAMPPKSTAKTPSQHDAMKEDSQDKNHGQSFLVPISDVAMENVLLRNDAWVDRRQKRIAVSVRAREARELAECTFTPRRHIMHQDPIASPPEGDDDADRSHRQSLHRLNRLDEMALAAEGRVGNELETLRSQAAFADPCFLSAVLEGSRTEAQARVSLSRLSFENAPRLHWHAFHESTHRGTPSTSPIPAHSLRPSIGRSPMMPMTPLGLGGDGCGRAEGSHQSGQRRPHVLDGYAVVPPKGEDDGLGATLRDPWEALDAHVDYLLSRSDS